MKVLFLTVSLLMAFSAVQAQRYFTRSGSIRFYSDAPMEKIEAENNQVSSIMDLANGELAFSLQMRGFKFEKALMEEHFNENYVESHKFPKASFKGTIKDFSADKLTSGIKVPVEVSGELSMHGITQPVTASGYITRKDDGINIESEFLIRLKDYDIAIPGAVIGKIAEEVKIYVHGELSEYNN